MTWSHGTRATLPGFASTPDSKSLVISYGGKIWKVECPVRHQYRDPVQGRRRHGMGPLVHFEYPIEDSTLTVRQIRDARPSPDGKQLAYTALDRLWLVNLASCSAAGPAPLPPGCRPHRVTDQSVGEYSPAWSPDGRYIAWVTWTEDGGDVWRIRTGDPKARPEKLSRHTAFYENLVYSPTGTRLVAARGPRQQRTERENEFEGPGPQVMELVWIPAAGGDASVITPLTNFGQPHFTHDTTRVFFNDASEGLVSVRWDGTDRRSHLKVTGYTEREFGGDKAQPNMAEEIVVSPDSSQAVALVDRKVYLVALPITGGATPTVSISKTDDAPVPVRGSPGSVATSSAGRRTGSRSTGRSAGRSSPMTSPRQRRRFAIRRIWPTAWKKLAPSPIRPRRTPPSCPGTRTPRSVST